MKTKTIIATLALAGFAAATQANTIDFSANGLNNALGTTSTFNQGGTSITAYGFGPSGPVNLFSKNQGISGENGLGLVNDPNAGQNEITPGSFIQLGLPTTPASTLNLIFNQSITAGLETATIWWSATLGSLGLQIGTLTADGSFAIPGIYANATGFLGVSAGAGNVLLEKLDVTPRTNTPDGGATLILLGSALSAASLIRRKLIA